ncbi:MAG: pantoate--beta-alanine ligase, partial [Lachnospiraceae bacterium]|nr:pantoate--beta-alanine ligase [Lachnospiraceae bacterium]
DGLAKSSRNTYLNDAERQAALCLSRAVFAGMDMVKAGEKNADTVVGMMKDIIEKEPLAKIDYVSSVDAVTMADVHEIKAPVLFAMAVYVGKTRLIDNFITE